MNTNHIHHIRDTYLNRSYLLVRLIEYTYEEYQRDDYWLDSYFWTSTWLSQRHEPNAQPSGEGSSGVFLHQRSKLESWNCEEPVLQLWKGSWSTTRWKTHIPRKRPTLVLYVDDTTIPSKLHQQAPMDDQLEDCHKSLKKQR